MSLPEDNNTQHDSSNETTDDSNRLIDATQQARATADGTAGLARTAAFVPEDDPYQYL
jgi:hypothetical protein